MAEYFRRLASYATKGGVAIVDPASSNTSPPRQYTYGQLLLRATVYREHLLEVAQRTQKTLKGARVGLMARPGVDFIAALLGVWSVEAIVVPICLSHPLHEITYTVTDSDQEFIIYESEFHSTLSPLLESRAGIDISSISKDATPNQKIDFSTLKWLADTPCVIIYTSGTTGAPKGVVHTAQSSEFGFRSLEKTWQFQASDRVLHVLPLHHGHGLNLSLLLPLWSGATVEFMTKFDEALVWRRFIDTSLVPITVFMAVPTVWVKMIVHFNQHFRPDGAGKKSEANAKRYKTSAASLRLAISGSAALPGSIRDAWAEIANGYLLLERYGTTETGILYSARLEPDGRIQSSVGWPVDGVQTRLIAADGQDVSNVPDVMGEIQVKTVGLMTEYWRRPKAKAQELTSDGWWKTGDLAVIKDEHHQATFIQGRASADIIKSGGFKMSALEIEAAMLQLPFVSEVAVVGLPDTVWGEMVAAICVPVTGRAAELTTANVRAQLRSQLAPYKLPQKVHLLHSMPRNAMGKVQKKALRDQCFPQQQQQKRVAKL